MTDLTKLLWRNEEGQDIAEYAVMLAVILVIVIGTVRLIGTNSNNVFSSVLGHTFVPSSRTISWEVSSITSSVRRRPGDLSKIQK